MAVTWKPKFSSRLSETITIDGVSSSQVFNFDEFDFSSYLFNATSTVTATKCAVDKLALTAGAATIDLTSLTGPNGAAVTFNGLKVIGCLFFAPTTNSGTSVTVAKGASNGYELNSTHSYVIAEGYPLVHLFGARNGAVGGSAKTLDISGTGTDQLWFQLIAGG